MRRHGSHAIALVLLVACTGATTAAHSIVPGHAPNRIGDHRFCSVIAPITASGRLFYPPRYPPDAVPDADRCFASVEDARRAGLRAAPPPPGSHVIGGVYLMPVAPHLSAICRRVAARFGFAVACPGLAPFPADSLEGPYRPGFLLEENFEGPPTYVGMGTVGVGGLSVGHLWVGSSVSRLSAWSICFDRRLRSRPTSIRGHPAAFVSCPEGSSTHSGHIVLFWKEAGAWHLVSLHGHSAVNRRMDRLIASSSRIIGPG
jgi:hypothetical protein